MNNIIARNWKYGDQNEIQWPEAHCSNATQQPENSSNVIKCNTLALKCKYSGQNALQPQIASKVVKVQLWSPEVFEKTETEVSESCIKTCKSTNKPLIEPIKFTHSNIEF